MIGLPSQKTQRKAVECFSSHATTTRANALRESPTREAVGVRSTIAATVDGDGDER